MSALGKLQQRRGYLSACISVHARYQLSLNAEGGGVISVQVTIPLTFPYLISRKDREADVLSFYAGTFPTSRSSAAQALLIDNQRPQTSS